MSGREILKDKVCVNCVNFTTHAGVAIPKCNLKSLEKYGNKYGYVNTLKDSTCENFARPVPRQDLKLGDLIEFWMGKDRLVGILQYVGKWGHISAHPSRTSQLKYKQRYSSSPHASGINKIIKITQKQFIPEEIMIEYFGGRIDKDQRKKK